MRPEASEGDPEGSIEWREVRSRMPVDVDGELLAEGQLHDGLALAAPGEGEGAAQHRGDEGEQRPKHRRILAAAGVEWQSESRVEAVLSSTDHDNRSPGRPEQNPCGRILGTHRFARCSITAERFAHQTDLTIPVARNAIESAQPRAIANWADIPDREPTGALVTAVDLVIPGDGSCPASFHSSWAGVVGRRAENGAWNSLLVSPEGIGHHVSLFQSCRSRERIGRP